MVDILNNRFGRLVAVKYIGKDKNYNALWQCVCDCGNITVATYSQLNNYKKQSCGCLANESRKKIKGNIYEIKEDYIIGYTSNTNKAFYVDIEDYEKIKNYTWQEGAYGYIINKIKSITFIHRLIMNVSKGG